ncbi:hypothetical protein SPI_07278 [Niveomyces insectorum RCEF 264]|uniref:BZIP transcription factor n=1 Tax=Niveomyces insectorum RCEF 264 TaxID=1081102 RepID=A0A167QGF0_9HYPO|nr:hypothetical protein SPI_07278 [Niveomyces insectorum RCEF 264]
MAGRSAGAAAVAMTDAAAAHTASSPSPSTVAGSVSSARGTSLVSATSPASVTSTTSLASATSLAESSVPDGTGTGTGIGTDRGRGRSNAGSPPSFSTAIAAPKTKANNTAALTAKDIELQRKRARDRKSQQAMRDRTKWTIFNLNEQVAALTQMLNDRTRDVGLLNSQTRLLETENAQLRAQNAALQLSLMGSQPRVDLPDDPVAEGGVAAAGGEAAPPSAAPAGTVVSMGSGSPGEDGSAASCIMSRLEINRNIWEIPPTDGPPTCLSDQILQGFVTSKIHLRSMSGALAFSLKPNLCSLLEKDQRTADAISDVVGDIVRSYFEIDILPKQVAVFYIMCSLLKWMVLLDKPSWDLLPLWLRPTRDQIRVPHSAWIDRIPWPNVRNYLIAHPEITLDHFASVYSTSFNVRWPYDPEHVIVRTNGSVGENVNINPVYEQHIRQLSNWEVGKPFRDRYPEISDIIDNYAHTRDDALY